MRILTEIGNSQIKALDELSKREKTSRAALIRRAVEDFITKHRQERQEDAFGLWGDRQTDGLAYQEKLRNEW
jgi:metal-responsive CopG/Arc/MetJ family transcriptional regulator